VLQESEALITIMKMKVVITVTASSSDYRGGRKTNEWIRILHRAWKQAGCGFAGLEGSHETTKTLGELVYRLKFEAGTSYLQNNSETLPLEPACSRF
jgi:hypothetical protein